MRANEFLTEGACRESGSWMKTNPRFNHFAEVDGKGREYRICPVCKKQIKLKDAGMKWIIPKHAAPVTEDSDEPIRIKIGGGGETLAKKFVKHLYDTYPRSPINNREFYIAFSEDEFAMFDVQARAGDPNTAYVSWMSAYPQRQGVGTRALQQLQNEAAEFGVNLELIAWDKGNVSKSALTRFYKKNGFKKGMGDMLKWQHPVTESYDYFDAIIGKIAAMPEAEEVWFHGSRARGDEHDESDWDMLVIVADTIKGGEYIDLVKRLQRIASSYEGFDIQPAHATQQIARIAREEGELLWSKGQLTEDAAMSEEFTNAVDNWMDMWDSANAAKTILASPEAKPFTKPPRNVKEIYRAFVLSGDGSGSSPVAAYATNINGCYEFLQSLELDNDAEWVIVRKAFKPADFLLDYTALYEHIHNPTDYTRYVSEHELWMKPTSYYAWFDEDEIVEQSEAQDDWVDEGLQEEYQLKTDPHIDILISGTWGYRVFYRGTIKPEYRELVKNPVVAQATVNFQQHGRVCMMDYIISNVNSEEYCGELLDEILESLRRHKVHKIVTIVEPGHNDVMHLLSKFGFETLGSGKRGTQMEFLLV